MIVKLLGRSFDLCLKFSEFAFFFLALLLSSCSAFVTTIPDSQTATAISPGTAVASDLQPTHTPPIAATLPAPALTPIPSATTTAPLPQEAPTALPTLSPAEAKAFVLELTNDSQNCLLPCFWNIIPGKTEWQNVEAFLSTFAYSISYGSVDGTFSDGPVGDSFIAWMYLLLPEISNAPFSYAFDVRDGIVTMIDASVLSVPNNTLTAVLNEHGQPSEIWVLTAKAPMDDVLGFSLTLFYGQHHFLLRYSNWKGEIIDGKVHGCISGEESLRLVAWSPEEELTFEETIEGLHQPHRPIIFDLPLEEATGISVESFYETFTGSNEPICLKTPTELWPGP